MKNVNKIIITNSTPYSQNYQEMNMLKKLTGKLKIGKSDKALISKLDKIKETRETTPRKTPPKLDNIDEIIDEDPHLTEGEEQTEELAEELTAEEQIKQIEERITEKVEQLISEKTKDLTETIDSIKELDNRITKMDVAVSSAKQTVDMFKDRLDKVDENILELLSLYEVVSNTVNPFVGDSEGGGVNLERFEAIEKQISELAQNLTTLQADMTTLQAKIENPQNSLPEGFEDQINERFTTLESTIQAFQELVEMQNQNTPDTDALVENISQQVIEQLREQITTQIEEQIEPLKEAIKTELAAQTPQTNPETPQNNQNTTPENPCTPGAQTENTPTQEQYRLPHLDNRPETSIILLNWIEFLMEKVGRNNLVDVLDYYVEIGWISEEVSTKMLTYADGIDYYVEKPTWKLLPEDHTKSLMFIEQLRGNKIDKSAFSRLEREIDRVKHSMETLYGV